MTFDDDDGETTDMGAAAIGAALGVQPRARAVRRVQQPGGTVAITMIRRVVRRHSPRVWALWLIGVVLLFGGPTALADPAAIMFLLDPELLAVSVTVGAALLGAAPVVRGAATLRMRWQHFGRWAWASVLAR